MKLLVPTREWLTRHGVVRPGWMRDAGAWFLSLLTHASLLVVMMLIVVAVPKRDEFLVVLSDRVEPEDPLSVPDEFNYAEIDSDAIGTPAEGDADALMTVAPKLDAVIEAPAQAEVYEAPVIEQKIEIENEIRLATGENFAENLTVKGIAGVGVSAATGAVDRITQEILLSLEERKTLVVWFFDRSGSLEPERAEVIERFDRVYEELGVVEASGNPAFKQHDDKPLLTSVVAFGQEVKFLTPKPTDDVAAIKSAVAGIETDASGVELTFTAVRQAAERFRVLRTQEPRRNLMFVIFTDEIGDDETEVDDVVRLCRRYEIPVYCCGVPAPFGQREVYLRYVDPDPNFDQTPQWLPMRQGPESFLPELVKVGVFERDDPFNSSFGPYSLTRLCYETGGIYFAVQGDRDSSKKGASAAVFRGSFDPNLMLNYRPDYVSVKEYQQLVSRNKARAALVQAAQMSWMAPLKEPEMVFPKIDEADLARRLSIAQRTAAVLEPKIQQLYDVLKLGERDRRKLTSPRWQAGYDLSLGMVLALKVRTETYNAILAQAKSGMPFQDPKNDTWILAPANEITVGSGWEKMAEEAREILGRVKREHPGTPWEALAQEELKQPLGWKWREAFTDVAQRNSRNRPARQPDMPRPVKRPPPKL